MRNHPLQEVAKLAAGLAAADFLWLVWFVQSNLKSASFFGMTITQDIAIPAMIFEIAVFLILVHYGWSIGKIPRMRERTYILLVAIVFTVVAVAHLFRIFTGADLIILNWDIPMWLSWFGVAVATYLAYASFHFLSVMPAKGR
ncbi:MAG: hypothetical protein V4474_01825 [Patescibacteria group bacterium]